MKPIEQFSPEQLKRQQQILSHLGFYHGKIDGIWGPKTIRAKREFETSGFAPGVPNQGLPFQGKGPYPKGLYIENGLLMCAGFDPTKFANLNVSSTPVVAQPQSSKSAASADEDE